MKPYQIEIEIVTEWDDSSGQPVRISREIIVCISRESAGRRGELHCPNARNQNHSSCQKLSSVPPLPRS